MFRGRWIANGGARAFVSVKPYVRVVRYETEPGMQPVLHLGKRHWQVGIRTWVMEDGLQTKLAGKPAKEPGTLITLTNSRVEAQSQWLETKGEETAVRMQVWLDEQGTLHVRHGVTNLASRPRHLAAWSIAAFAPEGELIFPFGERGFRPVVLFGPTSVEDLQRYLHEDALALDLSDALEEHHLKFGVQSELGLGVLRKEHLWVSYAPFDPVAAYPEGGANLTTYLAKAGPERTVWGELEHVGPTESIAPGETTWLKQTIFRMQSVPDANLLPAVQEELQQRLQTNAIR